MDQAFYVNALAMADRHVAEGQEHIARQRRLIANLDALGADTAKAHALLEVFLATQQNHENDRQRIISMLHKPGPRGPYRTAT